MPSVPDPGVTLANTFRRLAAVAIGWFAALLVALPAWATNDAANGLVLYTANGCTGCHTERLNGANAPHVIDYAISTSSGGQMVFPALTASDKSDLAAYLATLLVNPTSQNVDANTPKTFTLTGIDLANAGFPLRAFNSLAVQTNPAHGAVNIVGMDATYTPAPNYVGSDSFTFVGTGPGGTSSVRTVNITVVAPPAPVAGAISANVPNSTAYDIDLCAAVSGGMTSVSIASNPTHGTVTLSGNIATYMPEIGYQGADNFTYRATGLGGTSAPGNVSITVGPPVLPVANNTAATLPANAPAVINLVPAITGYSAGVTVVTTPAHGTVTVAANKVTYTPAAGYFGPDSFTYYATNVTGNSNTATVSLTVLPPPPVAAGLAVAVDYNTAKTIDLAPSIQGVADSITITVPPAHGTAVVNGKQVLYTPAHDYIGSDAFTWKATNTGGDSPTAVVTITVRPPAPVARETTLTVPLNTSVTVDLAPFVTALDVSGIAVVTPAAHGTVAVSGTKVTYTPRHDYFGEDAFTYAAYSAAYSATEPSAPARVRVVIVGRPDLAADKTLADVVKAQSDTTKRFGRAQLANIHTRLEALHRTQDAPAPPPASLRAASGAAPTQAAASPWAGGAAQAVPTNGLPRLALDAHSDPTAGRPPLEVGTIHATPAQSPRDTRGQASDPLAQTIGSALMAAGTAARSGQVNLALNANAGGDAPGDPATAVWAAGGLQFGHQRASGDRLDTSFTTDGATIGIDRRFAPNLALGVALGYAQDTTRIGGDGAESLAKGRTAALYGAWQPARGAFVDAVVGGGTLDFDTRRYVPAQEQFAVSDRGGRVLFASLTAGHDLHGGGFGFSPYARLDYTRARLLTVTERGAAQHALIYGEHTVPSLQLALGLRVESAHETWFGYALPRLRLEAQRERQDDTYARVAYADEGLGLAYRVPVPGVNTNALLLGAGSELILGGGMSLGIDFQTRRARDKQAEDALVLRLSQQLDGRSVGRPAETLFRRGRPLGFDVDVGWAWDDNVFRSTDREAILADEVASAHVGNRQIIPLGGNTRVVAGGWLGGERFRRYAGLSHLDAGMDAELQYRADGNFATATWGLFASVAGEAYESDLRDGLRVSAGLTMRKNLTDRIVLFGALVHNERNARGSVFDTRDASVRGNLDYAFGQQGSAYLRGEFRRGDIVSTGRPSLGNVDLAKVFVADDAMPHRDWFAYRLDADTTLYTLGYNRPLGQRDSLDLSLRFVESKPTARTTISGWEPPRYRVNQFQLTYLTSF